MSLFKWMLTTLSTNLLHRLYLTICVGHPLHKTYSILTCLEVPLVCKVIRCSSVCNGKMMTTRGVNTDEEEDSTIPMKLHDCNRECKHTGLNQWWGTNISRWDSGGQCPKHWPRTFTLRRQGGGMGRFWSLNYMIIESSENNFMKKTKRTVYAPHSQSAAELTQGHGFRPQQHKPRRTRVHRWRLLSHTSITSYFLSLCREVPPIPPA